jgi:phage shock protein A
MDYGRFRGAVFGGFNRQDVLEYIELSSKDYMRQLEERQQTLNTLEQANQSLTSESAQMRQRLIELEKTVKDAEAQKETISKLEQERDALSAQLDQANARLDESIARLSRIEPEYAQFEAIKTRLADIELDAHSHAAAIEQDAYDRTMKVGEQLSRTVLSVKEEYESLKECAAGASTHFRSDLEKIVAALDRFSGFFGEVENTLDHLLAQSQAGITANSPRPVIMEEPEAQPDEPVSEPEQPVREPAEITAEPEAAISEPEEISSEPEEAVSEPEDTLPEPEIPLSQQEETVPVFEAEMPKSDEPVSEPGQTLPKSEAPFIPGNPEY